MQTKGEGLWSIKKGIGFLLKCPLKEAYFDLGKMRS